MFRCDNRSQWLANGFCPDLECCAMHYILSKLVLNSNHTKSRSSITPVSTIPSSWNFCTEHGGVTAVLCGKSQNDLTMRQVLCINEISRDLSFRFKFLILHSTPGRTMTVCHTSLGQPLGGEVDGTSLAWGWLNDKYRVDFTIGWCVNTNFGTYSLWILYMNETTQM